MPTLRTLSFLLAAGSLTLMAQGRLVHEAPSEGVRHLELDGDGDDTPKGTPRTGPGGLPIRDNPTRRREAMRQWYGEWTPEYRKFILDAAASERREHRALMPKSGAVEMGLAAPATGSWSNIGPAKADVIKNGSSSLAKTDSGRPRSIVIDPNNASIIYLCTAGGGVWKTTNGGANWAPISDTLGSLSSGFLAMDPSNSSVLYLGLGDPFDGTGIGLVKSTDGGATWGAVQTLGASRSIRSIHVNPSSPTTVLVATDAGLFRSTDSGANYAAVASIPSTYTCWDLAWAGGSTMLVTVETDPANANGDTAGKIFRSTDGGATWAAATGTGATATRISLSSAPSNRQILYAMAGKSDGQLLAVYKSLNGGATWATTSSTGITDILGGQGWYNHAVLVDRANPDVVYLGGTLYLAKSTNGGSTWTKKSDWLAQNGLPYIHADFHATAQDSNGALYMGTDGGIFKSSDAAATWTDTLNIGITSHLIYSVGSSLNKPDAVIGGFQDNGTRVRSGATSTFNQYIGGDGFGSLMHPVNGDTMLGSLYYSRVYKSTNGGTTFTSASSGITESNNTSTAPFITRLAASAADATGNTVYTFANAKVYKSTNFATSWTAMGVSGLPTTGLYIRNIGAAASNGSAVGLVANSGRVYLTANGGSTWTQAATLPNNGSYTSSIAFDPTNHNTVYVSSVAPSATVSHLWKSANFGGSWTALDGTGLPAGVPINVVTVDPGDRTVLYAATQLGLYRSADEGVSWTRWGTGLPLVNVTDAWVAPDSSKVRVATFGRGFWELQGQAQVAVSVSPATATVNTGATYQFNATVTGTTNTAVTWTASAGTVSASGLYTAPATVGTYSVTATSQADATKSASATVNVTSNVDTTAPAVSASESGTSATITLSATATDAVGVTRVEFYVDNVLKGTDTTAPYSMTLDSTTLADGPHSLVAKAYDAAGNMGTSTAVNFNISNAVSTTYTEVESNGSTSTANVLGLSVTGVIGKIGTSTDKDYFRLTVAAGRTLTLNMTGPAKDYDLYLLNSSGSTLKSSTGSSSTESITYTNTSASTATYYIRVQGYKRAYSTTGTYTVTISR